MRRKVKIFFPIIRNTFFHKNNTSTKEILATIQIQQHHIFFLSGDSINFFSAAKSKSFLVS
jgi:hypothetical protein